MQVFVYGTLRKNNSRAGVLDSYPCVEENALLEGFQMLHLGGFPGIIPGEGVIKGEVYEIDEQCLKTLDGIEGYRKNNPESSLYLRETVEPLDNEGNSLGETFTYIFNRDDEQKYPLIESGDWMEGKKMLAGKKRSASRAY